MPPLLLDDDEAVAVAIGLRTATPGAAVAGIEETSLRALAKLEQVLPPRLRRQVSALQAVTVQVRRGRPGPTVDPAMLTEIARHARDHFTLRFDYSDRRQEASQRRVEPYRIVNAGLRWYLVAWDLDREDWRTFRVDRMREGMSPGPRFTPRELTDADAEALVARGVPPRGAPAPGLGRRPGAGGASCGAVGPDARHRHPDRRRAAARSTPAPTRVEQLAAWLGHARRRLPGQRAAGARRGGAGAVRSLRRGDALSRRQALREDVNRPPASGLTTSKCRRSKVTIADVRYRVARTTIEASARRRSTGPHSARSARAPPRGRLLRMPAGPRRHPPAPQAPPARRRRRDASRSGSRSRRSRTGETTSGSVDPSRTSATAAWSGSQAVEVGEQCARVDDHRLAEAVEVQVRRPERLACFLRRGRRSARRPRLIKDRLSDRLADHLGLRTPRCRATRRSAVLSSRRQVHGCLVHGRMVPPVAPATLGQIQRQTRRCLGVPARLADVGGVEALGESAEDRAEQRCGSRAASPAAIRRRARRVAARSCAVGRRARSPGRAPAGTTARRPRRRRLVGRQARRRSPFQADLGQDRGAPSSSPRIVDAIVERLAAPRRSARRSRRRAPARTAGTARRSAATGARRSRPIPSGSSARPSSMRPSSTCAAPRSTLPAAVQMRNSCSSASSTRAVARSSAASGSRRHSRSRPAWNRAYAVVNGWSSAAASASAASARSAACRAGPAATG